jgi:hypothetical protein
MSNTLKMLPTVTVGTTAVAVDQRAQGEGIHKYASISIQADPANTGKVYVGDNSGNLSTTTYVRVLNAGDWMTIAGSAVDPSRIMVLGSVAGQIVHVGAS